MVPVLGALRLPWHAGPVAGVCRQWASAIRSHASFWATLVVEPSDAPLLSRVLSRAGPRVKRVDLSACAPLHGCLSDVPLGVGGVLDLTEILTSCPNVEDLNLAGLQWFPLLTTGSETRPLPGAALRLRRLNIRGCYFLHQSLPALLGPGLQSLEAGWLSEHREDRDMVAWSEVFAVDLFNSIGQRAPNLRLLRVPGFILSMTGMRSRLGDTMQHRMARYESIGSLSALSRLRRLDLSFAAFMSDGPMLRIVQGCPRLRSINVRACQHLTDRSIQAIAAHLGSGLVHINASCCNFSDGAVRQLGQACPSLKTLDLCYCHRLSHDFVNALSASPSLCPHLSMLGAGGLDVGDEEIQQLCTKYADSLTHLGIGSSTRLTDVGLQHLARLPKLRRLSAHRLRGITITGLLDFCNRAPSLVAVDADECEYFVEASTIENPRLLQRRLAELPYSYDTEEAETDVSSEEGEDRDPNLDD